MTPIPFRPAAVLFDLDGVVIHSETQHIEALSASLEASGVPTSALDYSIFVGHSDAAVIADMQELFPRLKLDAVRIQDEKNERYREVSDGITLIPGVLNLLHHLKATSIPTALVTSSIRIDQQLAFELFELAPYFDAVITADDVTATKPAPEPYQKAATLLRAQPEACVVIEDSRKGIRAGVAAGCYVLGLSTSFPVETLLETGASAAFDAYTALTPYLLSAFATS